jgi:hypothetical protein
MKKNKTESNNNQERVKVYIRIRPFNDAEIKLGGLSPFKSIDIKNSVLSIKTDFFTKVYAYDGIYDADSSQEQVFNISAKPVIDVRKYFINFILIYFIF